MSPRRNAQAAFVSAVVVLLLSAIAAYVTVSHLRSSQKWVDHTYQVQNTLGEIDAAVSKAARARNIYVATGNQTALPSFDAALPELQQKLDEIKNLTEDNPRQHGPSANLIAVTMQRINLFKQAIALKKSSPGDAAGQADIAGQDLALAFQKASIMEDMRNEEQRLLALRTESSNRFFYLTVVTLAISFASALVLFSIHYRLLTAELQARAQAERAARESEESLRKLTSRLLHVQDEERRKFSRELHDSLGQYLAGAKMNLEMFARTNPANDLLAAIELLDQSISETRTISHLLHPPLLDEVGFSSAAKWFLQGFSERSGVEVKIDVPDNLGRLPRDFELGLFRVLQESLTNIHRHSKSSKAEVSLQSLPDKLILRVKDYGNGIPRDLLTNFQTKGMSFGVGLSGMRERVRELKGQLDIQSNSLGTVVTVTLPRVAEVKPSPEIVNT
jgi:signal transduction histidine kinase